MAIRCQATFAGMPCESVTFTSNVNQVPGTGTAVVYVPADLTFGSQQSIDEFIKTGQIVSPNSQLPAYGPLEFKSSAGKVVRLEKIFVGPEGYRAVDRFRTTAGKEYVKMEVSLYDIKLWWDHFVPVLMDFNTVTPGYGLNVFSTLIPDRLDQGSTPDGTIENLDDFFQKIGNPLQPDQVLQFLLNQTTYKENFVWNVSYSAPVSSEPVYDLTLTGTTLGQAIGRLLEKWHVRISFDSNIKTAIVHPIGVMSQVNKSVLSTAKVLDKQQVRVRDTTVDGLHLVLGDQPKLDVFATTSGFDGMTAIDPDTGEYVPWYVVANRIGFSLLDLGTYVMYEEPVWKEWFVAVKMGFLNPPKKVSLSSLTDEQYKTVQKTVKNLDQWAFRKFSIALFGYSALPFEERPKSIELGYESDVAVFHDRSIRFENDAEEPYSVKGGELIVTDEFQLDRENGVITFPRPVGVAVPVKKLSNAEFLRRLLSRSTSTKIPTATKPLRKTKPSGKPVDIKDFYKEKKDTAYTWWNTIREKVKNESVQQAGKYLDKSKLPGGNVPYGLIDNVPFFYGVYIAGIPVGPDIQNLPRDFSKADSHVKGISTFRVSNPTTDIVLLPPPMIGLVTGSNTKNITMMSVSSSRKKKVDESAVFRKNMNATTFTMYWTGAWRNFSDQNRDLLSYSPVLIKTSTGGRSVISKGYTKIDEIIKELSSHGGSIHIIRKPGLRMVSRFNVDYVGLAQGKKDAVQVLSNSFEDHALRIESEVAAKVSVAADRNTASPSKIESNSFICADFLELQPDGYITSVTWKLDSSGIGTTTVIQDTTTSSVDFQPSIAALENALRAMYAVRPEVGKK